MGITELIATILSLIGAFLVSRKKRSGYIYWIISNIIWIIFGIIGHLYFQAFMFLVFTVISIQGFIIWGKDPTENKCLENMKKHLE